MTDWASMTIEELVAQRLSLRDQQSSFHRDGLIRDQFDAFIAITDKINGITDEILRRVAGEIDR